MHPVADEMPETLHGGLWFCSQDLQNPAAMLLLGKRHDKGLPSASEAGHLERLRYAQVSKGGSGWCGKRDLNYSKVGTFQDGPGLASWRLRLDSGPGLPGDSTPRNVSALGQTWPGSGPSDLSFQASLLDSGV